MTETTETKTVQATAPAPADSAPRPAAKQRIPWWAQHPPTLAVAGLLFVVAELVAYRFLGAVMWLVANAALALLLFGAVLAWRRKGRSSGGLLGRLFSARRPAGRGPSTAGGHRARSAGGSLGAGRSGRAGAGASGFGPRGRLGRLFGSRGGGAAGSGSGGTADGKAGGKPGLLSRLAGRGRSGAVGSRTAGASGAGGSAAGGGRPSVRRRGLFGRLSPGGRRGGASAGRAKPTEGKPTGSKPSSGGRGARSWRHPFGGKPTGGTGGSTGRAGKPASTSGVKPGAESGKDGKGAGKGSAETAAGRRSWRHPLKRAAAGAAGTGGGDSDASPANKVSRWNPSTWRSRTAGGATQADPDLPTNERQPPAGDGPAPAGLRHAKTPPAPKPAIDVPTPSRRPTAQRSTAMTTPAHKDDSSLQAWGKSLGTIAPALHELNSHHARIADANRAATDAIQKLTQQADSDLPVSNVLTAELQAIAAELKKLDAEAEAAQKRRQALVGRAEALPVTYRREHETDEDRLNAPRKSRAAEKRADVSAAEQDT